jgi:hypothetical protein
MAKDVEETSRGQFYGAIAAFYGAITAFSGNDKAKT